MNKKITIIGANYAPEDTAIGLYTTQLAEYLVSQGFEVTVLSGFPYYPAWKIAPSYIGKPTFYKETIRGVQVYRYKQYVPENPSFIKRILLLTDYTLGAFRNLFKIKETDLVLAIVPFTTAILLGRILAKRKKAKLWIHIQDFEFDAASESNLLQSNNKKNLFFTLLFKIESYLLQKSDAASTISHAMLRKLADKTNPQLPKYLLPNWVNTDTINPDKARVHPFLQSDKFKILYSGNIGAKQNWVLFIQLVTAFQQDTTVEFVVVGDGAGKKELVDKLAHSDNITFYKPVPYEDLSNLLCSADLHVLFQKEDVIDTVMPSKILGMMASAKPSIITGNSQSEVQDVMAQSKAGYYFSSDAIDSIKQAVIDLKENPDMAKEMGVNARSYVSEHFSSTPVLAQFADKFKAILSV